MATPTTKPGKLVQVIVKLAQEPKRFFELAMRLRELHDLSLTAFNTTVKGTSLRPRKAYDLVKIAETFYDKDIPIERLEMIGWTKLTVIARHAAVTEGTGMPLESYLDLAER